jgi:hypothetical protein
LKIKISAKIKILSVILIFIFNISKKIVLYKVYLNKKKLLLQVLLKATILMIICAISIIIVLIINIIIKNNITKKQENKEINMFIQYKNTAIFDHRPGVLGLYFHNSFILSPRESTEEEQEFDYIFKNIFPPNSPESEINQKTIVKSHKRCH